MGYQDTYEVEKIWTEDLMIISSRQEMSVEDFGKYFEKVFMDIVKKQATAAGRVLAIYHDEGMSPTRRPILKWQRKFGSRRKPPEYCGEVCVRPLFIEERTLDYLMHTELWSGG